MMLVMPLGRAFFFWMVELQCHCCPGFSRLSRLPSTSCLFPRDNSVDSKKPSYDATRKS